MKEIPAYSEIEINKVIPDGGIDGRRKIKQGTLVPTLTNAQAVNNALYYSTDVGKLVYKDNDGVVHELW